MSNQYVVIVQTRRIRHRTHKQTHTPNLKGDGYIQLIAQELDNI